MPATLTPSPTRARLRRINPSSATATAFLLGAPTAYADRHVPVRLYVEFDPANNSGRFELADDSVDWSGIVYRADGGDTMATVRGTFPVDRIEQPQHVEYGHIFHPDARVRIKYAVTDSSPILFQGYPQVHTFRWSEGGEWFECQCLSEGHERLRYRAGDQNCPGTQITSRKVRRFPNRTWVPQQSTTGGGVFDLESQAIVFNDKGKPNRHPEYVTFQVERTGKAYKTALFTGDADRSATYWTYCQALRYVVLFYMESVCDPMLSGAEFLDATVDMIDNGPVSDPDPFVSAMSRLVEGVSIQSMNCEEAIAVLCKAAGLHYQIAELFDPDAPSGTDAFRYMLRVFPAITGIDEDRDLRALAHMIAPTIHDLPREAPFRDQTGKSAYDIAIANRAAQCSLTIDKRSFNRPRFMAGHKEYECTLLLRPGWLPVSTNQENPNLDNVPVAQRGAQYEKWAAEFEDEYDEEDRARLPHSVWHPNHPLHYLHADEGRLWIFPDTTEYMNAGLQRTGWPQALYSPYLTTDAGSADANILINANLGGGIADAENWPPHPRPFLDTIGRLDRKTEHRDPRVFVNFKYVGEPDDALADPNWVPFTGGVDFDRERAAMRFTDANLWADQHFMADPDAEEPSVDPGDPDGMTMLRAYIEGHFWVAVVCTIRGDTRLSFSPNGGNARTSYRRDRARIVDLGFDKFLVRNRKDQNSFYDSQPTDRPEFETRDDDASGDLLTTAVELQNRMIRDAVNGDPEIFWIDQTYRIGDVFSGCAGLGIEFHTFPMIQSIEHVKDPQAGYRTILHLTDLRHAPDVGGT